LEGDEGPPGDGEPGWSAVLKQVVLRLAESVPPLVYMWLALRR
jgi:hypothetical protein